MTQLWVANGPHAGVVSVPIRRVSVAVLLLTIAGCGAAAGPKPVAPTMHGSARTRLRAGASRASGFRAGDLDMGIACARPNYVPCNRVGLAVSLRHPAADVAASVGSGHFVMKMGGLGGRGPRYWEGYLTRAGLTSGGPLRVRPDHGAHYWAGGHPLTAHVTIKIVFRDGHTVRATVPVNVRAGWG